MSERSADYTPSKIEARWQAHWKEQKTFRAPDHVEKPTYYGLDMFPYPSGAGLHIGHPEGWTATDILCRYHWAKGYNVLHPMGWDAFGLPAEQHAVKTGTHPAINTATNIENFRGQIERIGFAIDWDREVNTTDPEYYRWTQWIFLQLYKRGLAYVDEKPVWWCPELATVLANEEVLNTPEGPRSERGEHPVERRPLRQWVLRITAYAEKLLDGLEGLDWPDSTKRMQQAWIGKSTGAEVCFAIEGQDEPLQVYTTRPDTLHGVTYMVVAPEHPLLGEIVTDENRAAVEAYVEEAARKSDLDRTDLAKEKSGVFTGAYCLNPVNGERVPIWVADYVLISYGTGAIMAVPAHDERDHEFATTFELPIIEVIKAPEGQEVEGCFSGRGTMVNCGESDGMDSDDFKAAIIAKLEAEQKGKAAVNYKLRDWLFSRQRYWGEPFPILWVEADDAAQLAKYADSPLQEFLPEEPTTYQADGQVFHALPLPSGQLPLALPEVESYQPSGTGESPLANATEWLECWLNLETAETLPGQGEKPEGEAWVRARRETNTMPQWAGSCWYYLRYLDPKNREQLIDPAIEAYWGMPDIYIGGAEHAVLHLLYARFWHAFLHDIGVLKEPEPFKYLFHQGIILGEDGQKMSKSRGNVVNPDDIIHDYGADSLRLYEMFLGPLEAKKPWSTGGIEGIPRFLRKLWREIVGPNGELNPKLGEREPEDFTRSLHETIKKVSEDIIHLRLNTAISQMMICVNAMAKAESVKRESAEALVKLLAPFAPHIAEELWERLGHEPSVAMAPWPVHDESKLVQNEIRLVVQINGKVRAQLMVVADADKDTVLEAARTHEKITGLIEGKTLVKEIYVPGKIVNLVAK